MLQGYAIEDGRLRLLATPFASLDRLVWIDLLNPTEEEERAVEAALGLEVPTRDEMAEIEDFEPRLHRRRRGGDDRSTCRCRWKATTRSSPRSPSSSSASGW